MDSTNICDFKMLKEFMTMLESSIRFCKICYLCAFGGCSFRMRDLFCSEHSISFCPESEENHKDCQILCEDNEIKNEIKNTIMKIKMAKKFKEDVNADMLRLEQLLMFNTPCTQSHAEQQTCACINNIKYESFQLMAQYCKHHYKAICANGLDTMCKKLFCS